MAGKTVLVGCRLPHGIILQLAIAPDVKVELKGVNKATIIGADYATTEVDADFFGAWKKEHKGFAPLESGAIFEAKSEGDAKAIAKEVGNEKTGFEKMPQVTEDVKKASEGDE